MSDSHSPPYFGLPSCSTLVQHQFRRIFCTSCGRSFDTPLSCKNRFCDVCSGPRRRRIRAKLTSICSSVRSLPAYKIRFVTLTIPVSSDLSFMAKTLVASFRRLRQRKFWTSRVNGGCYVLEVKRRPAGWHLHLHSLVDSRYLDAFVLSKLWSEVSPGKIVKVKNVPLKAVISYVTKYLTKSELSLSDQVACSRALAGVRLFQPFGDWEGYARPSDDFLWTCPGCGNSHFVPISVLDRVFTDPYAKYIERLESLNYRRSLPTSNVN